MGSRLSYPEVNLSGKVAIVTGSNAGVGYETAKALAIMGAHTIIACRSREKALEAIERMKREVSEERKGVELQVEFMALDLASLRSTKEFTVAFREKNLPLHLLINNAGVAWLPFSRTTDGYEMHMQVNHLSHFLLTLELLPLLTDTAGAGKDVRIVFVSSSVHSVGDWDPDNMNAEREYVRHKFYPKSKLYNVMTAYAMQRRLQNVGITVSVLHPGIVNTKIVEGFYDKKILKFLSNAVMWTTRTPKQGAATSINCAVNPELNSQTCFYYDSCRPITCGVTSRNETYQEEMWSKSIGLIKDYLSPEILTKYGTRAE